MPKLWLLVRAVLAGCGAAHAQPAGQRRAPPPGAAPSWPGGSYSYSTDGFTTWTFPQDQAGGGGHGCMTQQGGDGVVRTDCW